MAPNFNIKNQQNMINISIDLKKIDKSRIKNGKNGESYYSITVDKKKEPDQYGNDHSVYNTPTKEEREAKVNKVYLGSGKEFIFDRNRNGNNAVNQQPVSVSSAAEDDLPF